MTDTTELLSRLDVAFQGAEVTIRRYQTEDEHRVTDRQQRMEQFVQLCDRLQHVWHRHLEAFSQKLKSQVEVISSVTKSHRSAAIKFHSRRATFNLTLTAMTDIDVRRFVLDYTLEIVPILMSFAKNRQLKLPLDNVDPEVVGEWIDDRLVETVQVYFQLHQSCYYLRESLVEDPIAKFEFPMYAAAATCECNGQTYFFISEEARDAFRKEHPLAT